jgi:hypothetical protein
VAEIPRGKNVPATLRVWSKLGLGDGPYLTGDFGLDAGALVDVDVGNAGVLGHIDIRQPAPETGSHRKRSAPTRWMVK